ncbi:MAG TPA: bifunctional diaminohydroxyphosphoribosylaminopyrimidine deaminase/5-amino-6-(5-phosphoribosylamino)uracil reductase, partial [Thermodesulforhabdus norvegica]|nr:bifunctional diaminohydroxyphosphoribosylaminopyrimidine deaminase/5-amino-6-(5-phosphoribosylamino)uracil reductase [Thermodesulforhabdus norvegica]
MERERLDELFMKKALTLAKRGLGRTSPNPAVGAVIVRDGKV